MIVRSYGKNGKNAEYIRQKFITLIMYQLRKEICGFVQGALIDCVNFDSNCISIELTIIRDKINRIADGVMTEISSSF